MNSTERIRQLKRILNEHPRDTLALYALAMEYQARRRFEPALELFDRLLKIDPDYVPAYHRKALVLIAQDRPDQALAALKAGVPRAVETGQFHARDQMRELEEQLRARKTS